jgi:hypothetical protein
MGCGRSRRTGIERLLTHRRQLDLPGPVQHQQQAAADHVAQSAIGLLPLPPFTQHGRQFAPAQFRMLHDQIPNETDVFRTYRSASITPRILHLPEV